MSLSNELPERHQNPVSSSTSFYRSSTFQHPSRNPETAQIALVSPREKRIPQDSSQGMNNIFTPERSEYARFRNEAGGFTQNAPGSLYPSNPVKNSVGVPTVYTVPYFSINRNYPDYKQLENNHLAHQSTPLPEPGRQLPVDPITNLRHPSPSLFRLKDNMQSMAYDSSPQDTNTHTFPHTGYYERGSLKIDHRPDDQVGGKWAVQRLVSSNSVPVQSASSWHDGGQRTNNERFGLSQMPPVQHGGSEFEMSYFPQRDNWPTADEGQVRELHPITEDMPSQNSQQEPPVVVNLPLAKNGDASSGSARGETDLHQSFKTRHKAMTDDKQLIQFRLKKRYLVRAFNHYEQGKLYQSHGSNDPTEMDIPSGGKTLRLQVHSDGNPSEWLQ